MVINYKPILIKIIELFFTAIDTENVNEPLQIVTFTRSVHGETGYLDGDCHPVKQLLNARTCGRTI